MNRRNFTKAACGAVAASRTAAWIKRNEGEVGDQPLLVVAVLYAREGKADDLGRELQSRVPLSRKEPGCLEYHLSRGVDDKQLFVLHEKWRSKADLDQHFEMPYMKQWAVRRDEFVATRELLMLSELA